jgi:6-phosphofructokinase 1
VQGPPGGLRSQDDRQRRGGHAADLRFDSAVSTATEALDKVHSTAESHDRVMVVELMGRYAGWIALYSGLSGSADVILLPEIPFDIEKVCQKIRTREAAGRRFSIVVVAEGARPRDGAIELVERRGVGTVDRLGGIGSKVARAIEHRTGKETRTLVLGHLQRGGSPTTYDRLLALRFGGAAVRAIADRAFGTMVGLNGPDITRVPLDQVVGRSKNVPLDSDIIATARSWASASVTEPHGVVIVVPPAYPPASGGDEVETLHGESIPDPTGGWSRETIRAPRRGPRVRTR